MTENNKPVYLLPHKCFIIISQISNGNWISTYIRHFKIVGQLIIVTRENKSKQ